MYVAIVVIVAVLLVVGVFLVTALFGAPYVASGEREIGRAFDRLRPLGHDDVVVDFGCGDGVVLRAAVAAGAGKAVGLEVNPFLMVLARMKSRGDERVQVKLGDMTKVKLPEDMTVVYVFGLDRVMKRLRPIIMTYAKRHGREICVISKAFEFDGMKPERKDGGFFLYRFKPIYKS